MKQEIEEVNEFSAIWFRLTPIQKRFCVAMTENPTSKDAAIAVGIKPQTAYNWNGDVKNAVEFIVNNIALATLGIIQANSTKAAMVKAAGLDSADQKIAQASASEILDRNIGKPVQRQEHTGAEGSKIIFEVIHGRDPLND